MDREQKILVEEKEFSNLYEDMAKEFLTSLKFDNSVSDNNNQLLFLSCFENSLSYFADEIYENFKNDIDPIDKFNNLNKWRELSKIKIFSNIISEEIENNGFINQINDSKKNRFILTKVVEFTADVAKYFCRGEVSYKPLQILNHDSCADTLESLGYYEKISELLRLSIPFLQEIMLSYKANVIVDRRNVVLSNPMIDITEKAIKLIDDNLGDGAKSLN